MVTSRFFFWVDLSIKPVLLFLSFFLSFKVGFGGLILCILNKVVVRVCGLFGFFDQKNTLWITLASLFRASVGMWGILKCLNMSLGHSCF